jgi:hypothetical protein
MQRSYSVGISLTKEILRKVDVERQDIPRSKFVQRILEKRYQTTPQELEKGP